MYPITEQDFTRHATASRATTPQGIKSMGLIQYASNQDIQESERRVQQARSEQTVTPIVTLSSHISNCFEENRINRESSGVERQMIDNLNQRNNEYSSTQLAAIMAQGGTKVFLGLTGVKCRAAEAWLGDVLSSHPFQLKPSPIPELPPVAEELIVERVMAQFQRQWQESGEMMNQDQAYDMANMLRDQVEEDAKEEAEDRAEKMERKIKDQMAEGKWDEAFDEFIHNMTTFKAGFIKGPVLRREKVLKFKKASFGGRTIATVKTVTKHVYEAPSPLDMYPSDGAKNCNEGNLIERIKFTRKELFAMKGLPGYDSAAIDLVLNDYGRGGLRSWTTIDSIRAILEDKGDRVTGGRELIEGKEFWGSVQGRLLIDRGMYTDLKGKPLKPLEEYEINALQVGAYLLYVAFNPHPLGHRPYSKTGWGIVPGSFWYKGVPELMSDLQSICNASIRAMVNNLGIGSGPQVVINDINRLAKGEKITQMHPWKIWQFINNARSQLKAIDFFQPKVYSKELMGVYDQFAMLADDYTGIPAYSYGNDRAAGAGRALANYEELLTPEGPVEMGSIKVGDKVCTTYGSLAKVEAVFPQGERDIFRMRFSDGSHVDCDVEHRWSVSSHPGRNGPGDWHVYTTAELLEKGLFRYTKKDERNPKGCRPKWALPTVSCVEFAKRDVKIDPYTMGALLGDGDARCRLTSEDQEIFDQIPYELGKIDPKSPDDNSWTQTVLGIRPDYHSYGLDCKSIHKFIPTDYLYNTKEVRLELLRGLMDIDGCCSKEGDKTFLSTSSERMVEDFRRLVVSLGAQAVSVTTEKAGEGIIRGCKIFRKENHRVHFYLPNERIFHLERKQSRVKEKKAARRYIVGIEHIGESEATCITVDAKNHLFVCANGVPTHNTARGLGMLMNSAARGIKKVIGRIDREVLRPTVLRQYEWNMLYDKDESIKGDLEIQPQGALAMILREQMAAQRMELLNVTANPIDQRILGVPGRAKLLREAADTLQMEDLVPDKKKIKLLEIELEKERAALQEQEALKNAA